MIHTPHEIVHAHSLPSSPPSQALLHIQARNCRDIPFDHVLRRLHLRKELRIANDARRVLHLAARLIQPRDDPYNSPLEHIRQIRDPIEAHPARPLVHDFHQPKARPAHEIVGVVARQDDLVLRLDGVDLLGNLDDHVLALFQARREGRLHVGLFLEDEGGEQRDDFFGREVGQHVFEDELGEDELVGAVDLACDFALELHTRAVVDEAEVFEHEDALLVVWEELQVLVGHELAELEDVLFDEPFVVAHGEVLDEGGAGEAVRGVDGCAVLCTELDGVADLNFLDACKPVVFVPLGRAPILA